MKILAKIIAAVLINAAALVITAYLVPGFVLVGDWVSILLSAAILTVLNLFLKPVLELFLGPVIALTLGLGLIIVNAAVLYVLDIFSTNLNIKDVPSLIYASIVVGFVNFILHLI